MDNQMGSEKMLAGQISGRTYFGVCTFYDFK